MYLRICGASHSIPLYNQVTVNGVSNTCSQSHLSVPKQNKMCFSNQDGSPNIEDAAWRSWALKETNQVAGEVQQSWPTFDELLEDTEYSAPILSVAARNRRALAAVVPCNTDSVHLLPPQANLRNHANFQDWTAFDDQMFGDS
jgi:hypothetical protein